MNSGITPSSQLPDRRESDLPAIFDQHNTLAINDYRDPRADQSEDDDEIDLRELWQVILRRKWLILSVAALVFALTILVTLMMTPIYRASTTIEIKPEDTKVLEYDIETQTQAVNSKDFYQTQYELLKSRKLADQVIGQLGLESELKGEKLAKPFFAEQLDSLKSSLGFGDAVTTTDVNTLEQTDTEAVVEVTTTEIDAKDLLGEKPLSDTFLAGLTIAPVKNSQIVTIHYDHPNPESAAKIANAVADNFVDMNLERRRDAAKYAEDFLSDELVEAKSKLLESEENLNNYSKERGIIVTGANQESLTSQKMVELNKNLTEAERDRVKAESEYKQAKNTQGATTTLQNATVQEIKKNLARLQSEYQAGLSSSSSLDNPSIQSLRRELAQLQSEYQASLASPKSFDNPVVQSLTRQLAELQSRYQAATSSSGAYDSPTVQGLTRQLADLESEYREKSQIYKPAYPLMVQLKQKMDSVRSQIKQETQAINKNTQTNLKQQINELQSQLQRETQTLNKSVQTNLSQQINELQTQIGRESQTININKQENLKQQIDELQAQLARETSTINTTVAADLEAKYLAAKQREDALREQLMSQKDEFVNLRDKYVGYQELLREVESNRNIYEGLLSRQKQVGVAGGVGSNNIQVVDQANIPFAVYKPNKKLNAALGGVLGLFLGLVLAFLLEFLDDRVKSTAELERLLNLPILGIIPRSKNKDSKKLAIMTQSDPRSAFAEAFRSLRTNLLFSTRTGAPKALAVTSAAASEGKTTLAINLATVVAQSGKTVLLVDTDLRNPSVHKRLGLENSKGLTNYLTAQDSAESVTQSCQIPDVYVITAGPMSPNPVELLSSERLDELLVLARQGDFDMVILDMPPVLGLADALIVSNRVDATVISVAMGESKKQTLVGAIRRLRQARANIIGLVMSKAKQGTGYGYQYDYNYYTYGHDKKRLEQA